SRVYCTRALSLNTCSNFSGSNTRSSVPRTMTLTGLRSMNFSKHSPKIISLAPGAFHCCGAFPCKPLSHQRLCNHGRFPPLQSSVLRARGLLVSMDALCYSRLVGDDEEATICTLPTYRELVTNPIQRHRGRVVDLPGDNLLAEFASAVDDVQGAVEIQQE